MSLFGIKKPSRRQFRKRVVVDEEEDEKEEEGGQPNTAANEVNPKAVEVSSTSQGGRSSKLSFEDDLVGEEGVEVFAVKKTNHSRRMAKMVERERRRQERRERERAAAMIQRESSGEDSEEEGPTFSLAHRLSEGFIPDAATIHAARKKREMARKFGGPSADYLSLNSREKTEPKAAKGKSRLVREDENDKSDSDQEPVMSFGGQGQATTQMRVLTALETVDTEQDDEETRLWEEEQINKGANVYVQPQPAPPSLSASSIDQSFLYGSSTYPGGDPVTQGYPKGTRGPAFNHTSRATPITDRLVPITMESLKSRLQGRLRDLEETHSAHTQRLRQIEGDMEVAEEEVRRLQGSAGDVSTSYQFYQEIRGYVRDLLSCLAEKAPAIERLEQSLLAVWRERAELLMERRRQDVQDQSVECAHEGRAVGGVDHTSQRRAVEREARRRRRREGRERGVSRGCAHLVGGSTHYEGLSSDDELLETNRLKFVNESEKIVAKASKVFSDVTEEFSKLSSIKQRFEEWKFGFPESYDQAYIFLCLPKIFAPFVRLQMLQWNPLEPGCADFESMSWFQVLMFYGYREGCEPDAEDEDLQLIPRLVEAVILPKLTALLQHVWDPLLASQTRRAVGLLKRLSEDYPTVSAENKATQALFTAAVTRLRLAVDNDVFIPLFTSVQLENTSSPKYLFFQRQFWSCVKFVGNLTSWDGLLSPDILQQLVLDSVLNRYLLLSLQNSPPSLLSLTKAQAIIFQLPEVWFNDGAVVTRPLKGLARYLVHLADLLHRSTIAAPDTQRIQTRLALKKIAELLVKIHAHTEAVAVANEHKMDDILKSLKL